jgi:formate/nitrite transporter FocA (FNT family)
VRTILNWTGIALGGLTGQVALAFVVHYFVGGTMTDKKYDVLLETISAQRTQQQSNAVSILR